MFKTLLCILAFGFSFSVYAVADVAFDGRCQVYEFVPPDFHLKYYADVPIHADDHIPETVYENDKLKYTVEFRLPMTNQPNSILVGVIEKGSGIDKHGKIRKKEMAAFSTVLFGEFIIGGSVDLPVMSCKPN